MAEELAISEKHHEAYNLYEELKTRLIQHGYVFLKIGSILKKIRDEKLYKEIGEGGLDDFQQFLASPEIAIKRTTAYLYIQVYEFYVEKLGLAEEQVVAVPSYKLYRLLPLLRHKTKEEVMKVLDDTTGLGVKDTEEVINEKKLDPYRRPKVYRHECGKWVIEYHPDSLCTCDNQNGIIRVDLP